MLRLHVTFLQDAVEKLEDVFGKGIKNINQTSTSEKSCECLIITIRKAYLSSLNCKS